MEAVIFIGVQGAGKTTFYRERFFHTHLRISLDMLRTRRREQVILAACLESGQPFVVDNTNPTPADRARYLEPAQRAYFKRLAYFFSTPLQEAIRRNNERKLDRVPVAAVVGTFKRVQPPALDEGFDKIYTVELNALNQFVIASEIDTSTSIADQ